MACSTIGYWQKGMTGSGSSRRKSFRKPVSMLMSNSSSFRFTVSSLSNLNLEWAKLVNYEQGGGRWFKNENNMKITWFPWQSII